MVVFVVVLNVGHRSQSSRPSYGSSPQPVGVEGGWLSAVISSFSKHSISIRKKEQKQLSSAAVN